MSVAGLKLPSLGQVIKVAAVIAVLFFLLRTFAPEQVKGLFRV